MESNNIGKFRSSLDTVCIQELCVHKHSVDTRYLAKMAINKLFSLLIDYLNLMH